MKVGSQLEQDYGFVGRSQNEVTPELNPKSLDRSVEEGGKDVNSGTDDSMIEVTVVRQSEMRNSLLLHMKQYLFVAAEA